MFFEIFIQMMPYLAVFAVLGYILDELNKKRLKKGKRNRKRVLLELVM